MPEYMIAKYQKKIGIISVFMLETYLWASYKALIHIN
uniref:Uncharacterized protein n=1 Tax=Anguilla anguilla TaxID=7936 RepID=A0A0E9QUM2_ANGAN